MFILIDTSSNLGTYKCTLAWKAIMWKVSSTQPGGDQLWTDQHLVGVCLFLRLISKKNQGQWARVRSTHSLFR